jgi:hypothetical protein
LPYEKQENILKYLKGQDGVSLRQIARVTGFTVNKVLKEKRIANKRTVP